MKLTIIFLIAVISGLGLTYFLFSEKKANPAPIRTIITNPPTSVNFNPTEVFQRAFWRHPSPSDKILHAERREWADVHGVHKWQWFIHVMPSPGLVENLREAFHLTSASTAGRTQQPPSWFTPSPHDTEIFQSPHGSLRMIFDRSKNVLYATDSGTGFRVGAPETTQVSPTNSVSTGRLPQASPPNPPRK